MASSLEKWALPELQGLLPLDDAELKQIISYAATLPEPEVTTHFTQLLGDTPQAIEFVASFNEHRNAQQQQSAAPASKEKQDIKSQPKMQNGTSSNTTPVSDEKVPNDAPPAYAAPPSIPANKPNGSHSTRPHTNQVIEAAKIRAVDEQEMQNHLQTLQYQYNIYNSDIEPEHETDYAYSCTCPVHQYQRRKYRRYPVQKQWSEAVMYPGEKAYDDNTTYNMKPTVFSSNPYQWRVVSPYGYMNGNSWGWGIQQPSAQWHARAVHQTIDLNNSLNRESQAKIDAREPKHSIWGNANESMTAAKEKMIVSDSKRKSIVAASDASQAPPSLSRFSSFRKSLGIRSSDERALGKVTKAVGKGSDLREQIENEERGRWRDEQTRYLVEGYQQHMGMYNKISDLRARAPIQYLHLLRAGYFEPIPVAWASQASNPLKFSIESAAGWRGITPAWRGYEDTAEERLYWVLNHREGSVGMRMKPDQISEMNMARERMARAVDPPPDYYAANDQCHIQHTSAGYSKQVMPPPFRAYDRPETPTDDTMILLDVSGSMDFTPVRPNYDQYLVRGWQKSSQPKNKDVAKAIIRRFTDAMENHDHQFQGYDLITFANSARHIGTINHSNFNQMWSRVNLGGGTRVMTGWQKVKDLHFQKHSESATHHPIFGWQAGPQTPMLRLLLLLDGEATDMDEFELDLLGLSWAHVTIFLIGVDGCPHHHRHANELQRISDVNHHVSFVDAQGNCPERFVTHELLKRHLGYEISMREFEEMEELPAYSETAAGR